MSCQNNRQIDNTVLKNSMRRFGQVSSAFESSNESYNRHLLQGLFGLALGTGLALSAAWPALTLIVTLLGSWRLLTCFAIDERCETLAAELHHARDDLHQAMNAVDAKSMFQQAYNELDGEQFQGYLAHYLPGPVEVRRRSTRFDLRKALAG